MSTLRKGTKMPTVKERPIIFSTEMVRAILDGTKTMTRRTWGLEKINKDPDNWIWLEGSSMVNQGRFTFYNDKEDSILVIKCPYGGVGDFLVIKETWASENRYNHLKPSEIPDTAKIFYLASESYDPFKMGIIRPSIFMPYKFSRGKFEITKVRVERLQEITEEDAIAEGIKVVDNTSEKIYSPPNYPDIHRDIFIGLWDSLNAKRGYGWETNPFVWVLSFKERK